MAEDWEAAAGVPDGLPAGWRRHYRGAHLTLLRDWVGSPAGRWLKTDAFEELARPRALLPHLPGEWVVMDVAHHAVAAAPGATRVQADVRRLPFADGCFDGVLSTSTLDHFDDVRDIDVSLAELARVLRPGGQLVLTLDNASHPLVALRNALPGRVRVRTGLAPFHVGPTLDERRLRAAVSGAGLSVQRTTHLLHAPHVVGTRLARFGWYERAVLPAIDRVAGSRATARFTGHFVAVHAVRR